MLFVMVMLASSHAQAQLTEHVVIKGRGIVPSHLRSPLNLTLVVGDSACVWVKMKGKGRFEIGTDKEQRYQLRFEQTGSVTKVIQVDTRYAERKVGSRKRVIAFDVMMEPVNPNCRFRYTGPVGRIAFHRSNGRQQVEKDYARELPAVVEIRPVE